MAKSATSATAVAPARVLAPHAIIEQNLARAESAALACSEISKIFNVGLTEVALMRVDGDALNFLFPAELRAAGSIPLSSTSAVAARTANTRKVELFNNFGTVQHANVFETIKLATAEHAGPPGSNTIQKLMSTPIIDSDRNVLGVIQVCHKGLTPEQSGPDFTLADLQNLELAAKVVSRLAFMKP